MRGHFPLIAQHVFEELARAKNILIVSHHHPDGDTLGSATALAQVLSDKSVHLFCVDFVPSVFTYLPSLSFMTQALDAQQLKAYDCICVMDMGDLRQTGRPDIFASVKEKIINIDHHSTNDHFGKINCVFFVSSTCELVYHLLIQQKKAISPETATALLTGIMTDTDGFTNSATTKEVCRVAAHLLRLGAKYKWIVKNVFKNKSVSHLQLWGTILSHVQVNTKFGCVSTLITKEEMDKYQVDEDACAGIANFLNSVTNARMTLVLRELPDGKIKGSFRTTREDVDVSKIAAVFGGGGHKKAAGFTIPGSLQYDGKSWKVI